MIKGNVLVLGSRGMDASNLIKFLIEKRYNVIGADRRSSSPNYWRHKELGIEGKFVHETVDITDFSSVCDIIVKYKPEMIFNLAAMSFVAESFHSPISTVDINTNGHLNILEAVRKFSSDSKVYFAGSSEMFGKVQEVPQKESTPFYPRSMYGVSKLASYWATKNYRESYGMFACSGILFNHEGVLRGSEFVTRKITQNIARWYHGKIDSFEIGNIYALRDWGASEDYVEGMFLMLQQEEPDDYILATNEMHSVKQFIEKCFDYLGCDYYWEGVGIDEKLYVNDPGYVDPIITISKEFYRPCEVHQLLGDYSKAKEKLGWQPKTTFKELVITMLRADIERESYNREV